MPPCRLDFLPFGAQYYRAPTPPPAEWATDLREFRRHGFNCIKLWAQWGWNNPAEDLHDFDDLRHLLELAAENHLRVVVNAIYDVAPAWFWARHPDSAMVLADGRRLEPRATACRQIGGTPGPSFLHPEGIELRRRFTIEMARALAGMPALWCWDLWNEPELTTAVAREATPAGLSDYSPWAVEGFRQWLRARHGDLASLNERWGRRYTDWEHVQPPRDPASFQDMVDWRMYFTDVLEAELVMRLEALRSVDPSTPAMVHTVPVPFFNTVTCASIEHKLARHCDLFGNSIGSHPFAASATCVAAGGMPVINAEIHAISGTTFQRPGIPSWDEMKRHFLVPLAQGSKGFLLWQYRPETLGAESPAWGLTDLAGGPTPWLAQARSLNDALQRHAGSLLASTPAPAPVAIINSARCEIFDWCAGGDVSVQHRAVTGAFMSLWRRNIRADVIAPDQLDAQALARYRVVLFPRPYYLEEKMAALLEPWVRGGGVLIAEAFFGSYLEATGRHATTIPGGGYDEVFGVREGTVLTGQRLAHSYGSLSGGAGSAADVPLAIAGHWTRAAALQPSGEGVAQELAPREGTEVLARFRTGGAAITRARQGKGVAIHVGTHLCGEAGPEGATQAGALIAALVEESGVEPAFRVEPAGVQVEALLREGQVEWLVVTNGLPEGVTAVVRGCLPAPGSRLVDVLDGLGVQHAGDRLVLPLKAGSIHLLHVAAGDLEQGARPAG